MAAAALLGGRRRAWRAYYAGRHALVTGASEGAGLELAKALAAAGARVTLVARTIAKLEAAADACAQAAGLPPGRAARAGTVCVAPADVTDEAAVRAAVAAGEAALGPVDVLICCAGAAECGYFHTTTSEVHRRMMDLNYMGVVHATRAVVPGMIERRSGHVIAVASTLSLMGAIGYCAYAPSKFAVRGFMESLRQELQGTGVRASICYPPDMDTPGYAREGLTKPPESLAVSGDDALYPPDQVAESILSGAARPSAWVLPNLRTDVHLLQDLTLGLVPRDALTVLWVMVRCFFGPLICWAIASSFDRMAARHAPARYAGLWGSGGEKGGGGENGKAEGGGGGARKRAVRAKAS